MTDAQEFNIPLDSPLDINMNDQLVHASKPLFTYNRQKWLGGLNQTSIRYEDDGYFAGWWRHQFSLVSDGYNRITPSFVDPENSNSPAAIEYDARNLLIFDKKTSHGWPYWVAMNPDQGLRLALCMEQRVADRTTNNTFTGTFSVLQRVTPSSDMLRVEGKTEKGNNFIFNVNIFTGAIEVDTQQVPFGFYADTYLQNNVLNIKVDRALVPANDWFIYRKNTSLYINGNVLDYREDATDCYWDEQIKMNKMSKAVMAMNEFSLINAQVNEVNTINESIEISLRNKTTFNIDLQPELQDGWNRDTPVIVEVAPFNTSLSADGIAGKVNSVVIMPSTGAQINIGVPNWYDITSGQAIYIVRTQSNYDHTFKVYTTGVDKVTSSAYVRSSWTPQSPRFAYSGFTITVDMALSRTNTPPKAGYSTSVTAYIRGEVQAFLWYRLSYTLSDGTLAFTVFIRFDLQADSNGWNFTQAIGNAAIVGSANYPMLNSVNLLGASSNIFSVSNEFDSNIMGGKARSIHVCVPWCIHDIVTVNVGFTGNWARPTVNNIDAKVYLQGQPSTVWAVDRDSLELKNIDAGTPEVIGRLKYLPTYGGLYVGLLSDTEVLPDGQIVPVPGYYPLWIEVGVYQPDGQALHLNSSLVANAVSTTIGFKAKLKVTRDKYIINAVSMYNWQKSKYNGFLSSFIDRITILNSPFTPDSTAYSTSFTVQVVAEGKVTTIACRWEHSGNGSTTNGWRLSAISVNVNTNLSYIGVIIMKGQVLRFTFSSLTPTLVTLKRALIPTNVPNAIPPVAGTSGFVPQLQITSQNQSVVQLSNGFGNIDLNLNQMEDTQVAQFITATEESLNVYKYYVAETNSASAQVMPLGIFQRNSSHLHQYAKPQTSSAGGLYNGWRKDEFNSVYFTIDGVEGERLLTIDTTTTLNLLYETKDIRNTSEAKFVYRNDLTGVYQFVKQFWSDTVATENYWWIDERHVLELRRDDMIMWKKRVINVNDIEQSVLDNWDGDQWELDSDKEFLKPVMTIEDDGTPVKTQQLQTGKALWRRVPRGNFIGINDLYYTVSNAKDGYPVFFKLSVAPGSITVHMLGGTKEKWEDTIFNRINEEFQSVTIDVYKVDFGNPLETDAITAYVDLNTEALISTAKISSTYIDGVLLLGIAYTRGLLQWTIKIDGTTVSILNGYGHVGIDGTLTGGQLPAFVCSNDGFNGAVNSLSELTEVKGSFNLQPDDSPSLPNAAAYGSGSRVWFLNKEIYSIVSHYTYDRSRKIFEPVSLGINNNLVRRYESASFNASALYDLFVPPISFYTLFEQLFGASSGLQAVTEILLPAIYVLDPKFVLLSYINHTFGQYAYVWKNNAADYLPDGKTDQDVKFLEDKYNITFENSADQWDTGWPMLILKLLNLGDRSIEYVVNKSQNQTTTDDSVGRKFSQFFLDNIEGTVEDMLQSTGFNITLKSALSQSCTLNMFYSIDDKEQCFAGPGFVNHNFIAQCIAQSVTDTQLRGIKVGYWATLKGLSLLVLKLRVWVLEMFKEGMLSLAEAVGSTTVSPVNVPLGTALAAVFNILAQISDSIIITINAAYMALEQLCDAIGPSIGQAYDAGQLNKMNLSIEGTHVYGNKPMSFFYPVFGADPVNGVKYTNEWVDTAPEEKIQYIKFSGKYGLASGLFSELRWTKDFSNQSFITGSTGLPFRGGIKSVSVKCKGVSEQQVAPLRMAVVEGVKTFLSPEPFKNEQIGVAPVVFPPPPIHDYEIDPKWKLGFTASGGEIIWTTCDDTKIIDGPPSNMIITENFCGIASSYTAIEIKSEYDHRYLRPWAVTPQAIALNINKMNCVQDTKVYHAFDGQGNRIVQWTGGSGMDKAVLYQQYLFQVNDHFKRSNILPPSQFFGIFEGPPSHAMRSLAPGEPVANLVQANALGIGGENDIPGEQKNLRRFSIPVFSRQLSTLPAMVRMLAPYKLNVVEGITSLTTDVRTTQTRYKAPSSVDFNIYGDAYRATDEYLCSLQAQQGIVAVKDVCATAGLQFVGATTKEAYFFSPATRMYYKFANGREIEKIDVMNRFADLKEGIWDYVNQEVMFKALLPDNETVIVRLDGTPLGEVTPPNDTIYSKDFIAEDEEFYTTDYYNTENEHMRKGSGYKLLSMAGGTVYQGPKRFIVNRFILLDYMIKDIKNYSSRKSLVLYPEEAGKKNWRRVSRDAYSQYRDYGWAYVDFDNVRITTDIFSDVKKGGLLESSYANPVWWAIHGWTHNPYGLVTSMLGVNDATDCKFEWIFTFAWTAQMDKIYGENEYVTVNVQAETVSQGGTLMSEPTRIFLFKECFTRSGNAGYYTFKFQSNNGVGNRERLYVWGDAITAVQDLKLRCKEMTTTRTQPLYTQVDVQDRTEF